MKTETKQGPWNASMTESQTQELVRKYLCGRNLRHAHLGDMYIADYDKYVASHPAMFAIVFEYCLGTAYVTLEEFLAIICAFKPVNTTPKKSPGFLVRMLTTAMRLKKR